MSEELVVLGIFLGAIILAGGAIGVGRVLARRRQRERRQRAFSRYPIR